MPMEYLYYQFEGMLKIPYMKQGVVTTEQQHRLWRQTHLIPVNVSQKQHPALWRTMFGGRGWYNRGLRNLWQGDVPRCIDVKFATGWAHQKGTGLSRPQKGLLQGSDEVIPEQLRYFTTNLLVSQAETDTSFANCTCHSLFICITLGEVRKKIGSDIQ